MNATEPMRDRAIPAAIHLRQNALTGFARENCGNWDAGQLACIGVDGGKVFHGGPCLLAQGKPCRYFEKSVFPICDPSYRYATEPDRYQTLLGLYLKINPNMMQSDAEARLCECGEPLRERCQCCDKCRVRRQKSAARERVKKHRVAVTCQIGTCPRNTAPEATAGPRIDERPRP